MKNKKNVILISLAGLYIFGLFLWCVLKPADEFSLTERRKLAQKPELTMETVLNGSFTSKFDTYSADQFPLRETFRTVNSFVSLYVLQRGDVNDIYVAKGYASKLEPEIHQDSVDWGLNRLQFILDKYVTDNKVVFAMVPDKNYYLAKQNGYPYLDYASFAQAFEKGLAGRTQIVDLTDTVTLNDYYRTDTHWSQDKLVPAVDKLGEALGVSVDKSYETRQAEAPFYGVYYGQSALPLPADTIKYLTNDKVNGFKVTCFDTGKGVEMPVYDLEKTTDKDPYEMFLGGPKALITIENPAADNGRHLILFRDSFGSSLAPLLATGYEKVTLVDIRYLSPAMVGRMVDFEGADVLFLYSVSVLNNCTGQFIK